jgi:hypothetical protein
MSVDLAARWCTVLVMIGVAIGDIECLSQPAQLKSSGFYSWEVLRTLRGWTVRGPLATSAGWLFESPAVLWLFGAQLAAASLAIVGVRPIAPWIAIALVVNLLFHLRNQHGLDGSDQMQTIVLASLLILQLSPTETARIAALCFIGGQSVLSYLTAGIAKAISPTWRSGGAVAAILRTTSYGGPVSARVFADRPALSEFACYGTLVFECALPLLVFVSPGACLVFIAIGVAFHASIAATMGLNLFFWSFVSTYPALYAISHLVSVSHVMAWLKP